MDEKSLDRPFLDKIKTILNYVKKSIAFGFGFGVSIVITILIINTVESITQSRLNNRLAVKKTIVTDTTIPLFDTNITTKWINNNAYIILKFKGNSKFPIINFGNDSGIIITFNDYDDFKVLEHEIPLRELYYQRGHSNKITGYSYSGNIAVSSEVYSRIAKAGIIYRNITTHETILNKEEFIPDEEVDPSKIIWDDEISHDKKVRSSKSRLSQNPNPKQTPPPTTKTTITSPGK